MACNECGQPIRLRKSLVRPTSGVIGKQCRPDECPHCGAEVETEDRATLEKGVPSR